MVKYNFWKGNSQVPSGPSTCRTVVSFQSRIVFVRQIRWPRQPRRRAVDEANFLPATARGCEEICIYIYIKTTLPCTDKEFAVDGLPVIWMVIFTHHLLSAPADPLDGRHLSAFGVDSVLFSLFLRVSVWWTQDETKNREFNQMFLFPQVL